MVPNISSVAMQRPKVNTNFTNQQEIFLQKCNYGNGAPIY
jgi:hypothetical protein